MNASSTDDGPEGGKLSIRRSVHGARGKSAGAVAVVVLAVAYTFLQPHLNERFGWSLPAIDLNQFGAATSSDLDQDDGATVSSPAPKTVENKSNSEASAQDISASTPAETGTRAEKSADRPASRKMPKTQNARGPPESGASRSSSQDLAYGLLREVQPDRFLSPEGLVYGPGSAEGHRLEHLRRHVDDQPNRPGKHGVFDGGMEGAVATIDQAYGRAKKGQRTATKKDGGRTVYTVDLGKRVGYVGGREGNRRKKPMARRVRIVVEGNRFITAFPL